MIRHWFRKDNRKEIRDATFWLRVAKTTIQNRRGCEYLRDGAADAMAIAALSAQEAGASLVQVLDAIEGTYRSYMIYATPDEHPCDEWQPRQIMRAAT